MKNVLKTNLRNYLEANNKTHSWAELYEMFPFKGLKLTRKQMADSVRSVKRKMERENKREVVINNLPKMQDGQYLVLGCVHAPFINKEFWKSILKFADKNKKNIKGLIFNGDFLDLHSLSSHDRGRLPLHGISLGREYKESNLILDQIENILNQNIYKGFIYGNHEDRHNRYLQSPDNKKLEGAVLSPIDALKLKERNYDIYADWKNDELQLGDLTIIHGEFFNVHLCKKYLDVFKKNMLFAHSHRSQMYREGEHVAYNIGCVLDIDSKVFSYASKAMKKTWSNGFAVCTLDNNKTFVELINWEKNCFVYGGVKY